MAHGINSMGPFKWSYIYIQWDVLSHELQNGPCRKTFELEYLEIFIKLGFFSGIIVVFGYNISMEILLQTV